MSTEIASGAPESFVIYANKPVITFSIHANYMDSGQLENVVRLVMFLTWVQKQIKAIK
jgi:hypothetical protein